MHLCLTEGTFLFIHYLVATSMEDMHAPTTLKAFLSLIVDCLPALRTKIRAYMVLLTARATSITVFLITNLALTTNLTVKSALALIIQHTNFTVVFSKVSFAARAGRAFFRDYHADSAFDLA